MSAANVELIKRVFPGNIDVAEVLASDDPASAFIGDLSVIAPDLVVEFSGGISGGPPVRYQGLVGLIEGWRDWLTPWETYRLEPEDYIDAGDRVITLARVRGRTSRHGVELEHNPAAVWTLEDGWVTEARFFLERPSAFEFAGLTPP